MNDVNQIFKDALKGKLPEVPINVEIERKSIIELSVAMLLVLIIFLLAQKLLKK